MLIPFDIIKDQNINNGLELRAAVKSVVVVIEKH